MRGLITQKQLKEFIKYDAETGELTWIKRPARCIQIGDTAGGKNPDGYLLTQLFGRKYFNHALAFLYMEGVHPDNEIDHINSVRDDNRWSNLRHVTREENMKKIRAPVGISGVKGIVKCGNKWKVCINQKYLGCFKDIESAKIFIEGLGK